MILDIYIGIILFFLGASVGSFLNALSEKLYRGENYINGRSSCDECHHILSALDLIPVFSYLFLRGKCRYCKARIPIDLFFSEVLLGFFYSAAYFIARDLLAANLTMFYVFFIFLLFNISYFFFVGVFDYKYYIILDMPILVLSIIYSIIIIAIYVFHRFGINFFSYSDYNVFLLQHFITGVVMFLFFYIIYVVTKGNGIGGGDVKISFLIGLLLGARPSVVFLYVAFFSGAVVSLILLLFKSKKIKDSIPFGPFLAFGVIIAILYSGAILSTPYFSFLNYIGALF